MLNIIFVYYILQKSEYMKGSSMRLISFLILAILASGILLSNEVIRVEGKPPLPRCEVNDDCLPVCGTCKFCLCCNTWCVWADVKWEALKG